MWLEYHISLLFQNIQQIISDITKPPFTYQTDVVALNFPSYVSGNNNIKYISQKAKEELHWKL